MVRYRWLVVDVRRGWLLWRCRVEKHPAAGQLWSWSLGRPPSRTFRAWSAEAARAKGLARARAEAKAQHEAQIVRERMGADVPPGEWVS
ncbi:MAG: hypothetical protein ACPGVY_11175 [Mycobacterium sp.]